MLDWREYEANDGKKQSEAEEIINLNAVADTGADMCCTLPKEALKMGFKPKQEPSSGHHCHFLTVVYNGVATIGSTFY